jgi:hypothetical protein
MELGFLIFLVALTSTLAERTALRNRPQKDGSFFQAIWTLFEWAGLFTLFVGANLTLGAVIIVVIRTFTQSFVSLYALESLPLLMLSAAQAFVFLGWRR